MRQVAEEAADVFLASGVYAGVLTGDGQFLSSPRLQNSPKAEAEREVREAPEETEARPSPTPKAERSVVAEPSESQTFQVTLSAGQGVLRIPAQLTRQDVAKLRKLLEVVALDVEDGA